MREILARMDDRIIDQEFQPSVDWFSNQLRFDCFRLAGICADLSALAWILSQAGAVTAALGSGVPGQAPFRCVLLLLGLGAITILRTLFQKVGGGGRRSAQANPLRAGMFLHRLVCHFWLIGLLLKTAGTPFGLESCGLLAVGVCTTLAVYFGACSNPPPKRRESPAGGGWKLARVGIR